MTKFHKNYSWSTHYCQLRGNITTSFYSNSEAKASELLEKACKTILSNVISRFKFSTKHRCVTRDKKILVNKYFYI